ncbi:MAG: helix-turn-helix transcriptional regulator, partial [Candidatus Hodarchaeales archaeon]
PPPEPPSGGGGAGPPPVLPRKFILNFTNSTIITLNMKVSDKAYYYFDNENHTITVTNLTKDYVSLLIQSDPFKVTLNISQVIFVDLNSDDIYDLAITLDYIEAGKANITFTKLEIPETIETNSSENQTQEAPTGLLIASGTVNIISILVIILLFLTYLRLRKPIINGVKSKSKDLFMVMNGLTDKEKSIVDYLSDKGETKQSILCTELDISKASLSRWLRNLELKGIVKTKKFGKMKKINLSKQYK